MAEPDAAMPLDQQQALAADKARLLRMVAGLTGQVRSLQAQLHEAHAVAYRAAHTAGVAQR